MLQEVQYLLDELAVIKMQENKLNDVKKRLNKSLYELQKRCPHVNKKPKHIANKGEIIFHCKDCDADLYPR